MPCDGGDGGGGLELVDDVAGDEVDVVVAEGYTGEAHALPPQLVQLGVLHPRHALQHSTQCYTYLLTDIYLHTAVTSLHTTVFKLGALHPRHALQTAHTASHNTHSITQHTQHYTQQCGGCY